MYHGVDRQIAGFLVLLYKINMAYQLINMRQQNGQVISKHTRNTLNKPKISKQEAGY